MMSVGGFGSGFLRFNQPNLKIGTYTNASFAQMLEKLIASPIVKTLVFCKVPEKVRDWIDAIGRDWKFKRIIPAHFAAPINAGRSEFLAAFGFLDELLGERYITRPPLSLLLTTLVGKAASYFHPDDMKTLSSLDDFLVSVGAVKKTVSSKKRLKHKHWCLKV